MSVWWILIYSRIDTETSNPSKNCKAKPASKDHFLKWPLESAGQFLVLVCLPSQTYANTGCIMNHLPAEISYSTPNGGHLRQVLISFETATGKFVEHYSFCIDWEVILHAAPKTHQLPINNDLKSSTRSIIINPLL